MYLNFIKYDVLNFYKKLGEPILISILRNNLFIEIVLNIK